MNTDSKTLARGLGWFSLGLGLAEVLVPGRLARFLGMRGEENLLRLYGLREIATGVGILTSEQPRAWVWGRVAGDALDLATLAARLNDALPREQRHIAFAVGAVAGVTAADIACAKALEPRKSAGDVRVGSPRRPQQVREGSRLSTFH